MVNIQTGNMLDVVVEGQSIGLKQRDSDHQKHKVIWLPEPEGLRDVLAAEIERLNPARVDPPAAPTQHWPFSAKHDNCTDCDQEYEILPLTGKCAICGGPAPIGACCGGYSCAKKTMAPAAPDGRDKDLAKEYLT